MPCNLAIAWNWEFDAPLLADLDRRCRALGLTTFQVTPENVEACLAAADRWDVLFDRAWESDPRFRLLNDQAAAAGTRVLNPPALSARMGNKAAVSALLAHNRVPVPRLVDFMPAAYSPGDLARAVEGWKRPLWMKPANGGGGDGVVELRELPAEFSHGPEWRAEQFVIQENAEPAVIGGRPAWFRAFCVFGTVHLFWWHPKTHVFEAVAEGEPVRAEVERVAREVARASGLEVFSSEICMDTTGAALVVDPVNDPMDLRSSSQVKGGIAEEEAGKIVESLAQGVARIVFKGKAD